jgi:hypothetical protein
VYLSLSILISLEFISISSCDPSVGQFLEQLWTITPYG